MDKILDTKTLYAFKEKVKGLTSGSSKKVTGVCPMCGKERVQAYSSFIRTGHTRCKGCSTTLNAYGSLIGTKVGKLTILGLTEFCFHSDGRRMANFLAKCECGNTTTILGQSLRKAIEKNSVSSCGCYNLERARELGLSNVGENNGMYGKTGKLHPNYDHSLTEEYRVAKKDRTKTVEWQRTRKKVVKIYEQKCALCNSTHRRLEVHHIEGFKNNESLRYDPNNCILLCDSCHQLFHLWNGYDKKVPSTFELFGNFIEGLGGKIKAVVLK